MHWSYLVLDLLPLLVFVVLESMTANVRYALLGAILSVVFVVVCDLYLLGEIDRFTILSSGLVILFGWLALRFNNTSYFKIKPAVVNLIMAGVFLTAYLQDSPLLLTASDRYAHALPPQFHEILSRPEARPMLERMSLYIVFGFIAQAAVVAWAALKLGSWWWFAVRSAGFYVIIVLVGLASKWNPFS